MSYKITEGHVQYSQLVCHPVLLSDHIMIVQYCYAADTLVVLSSASEQLSPNNQAIHSHHAHPVTDNTKSFSIQYTNVIADIWLGLKALSASNYSSETQQVIMV